MVLWLARMFRIVDFPSPSVEQVKKVFTILTSLVLLIELLLVDIPTSGLLHLKSHIWSWQHKKAKVSFLVNPAMSEASPP